MNDDDLPTPERAGQPPLPDGWTLVNWVSGVTALDENGMLRLVTMWSDELTPWERVGIAHALYEDAKDSLTMVFEGEDDE